MQNGWVTSLATSMEKYVERYTTHNTSVPPIANRDSVLTLNLASAPTCSCLLAETRP